MELTIIYSKIAQQDLKDIYNYIRKDSLHYAKNEIKLIRFAITKLKTNALLGRKFDRLEDESTRELIYRNYRIVYDVILNKQITILTIHHHARSVTNNPAFTDED